MSRIFVRGLHAIAAAPTLAKTISKWADKSASPVNSGTIIVYAFGNPFAMRRQ